MRTVDDLTARLAALHERTTETPLFNPVFQLGHEVSRLIESGDVSLKDVAGWVAELDCASLDARAAKMRGMLAPVDADTNRKRFADLARSSAGAGWDAFAQAWQQPVLHAVMTAHPTFLLTEAQSDALAEAAGAEASDRERLCQAPADRAPITLASEHDQAMAALDRAQDARDALNRIVFDTARTQWPDQWRALRPEPFRFATWVGYDMDGRTDIGWSTSLAFRLQEKARRLHRYATALDAIDDAAARGVAAQCRAAATLAVGHAALFAEPMTEPDAVSAAANAFTADHPDTLVSLAPVIAKLEAAVADADAVGRGDIALALATVAQAMRIDGLGMGWIHFRVNASQLANAIRPWLLGDGGDAPDIASRSTLARLRTLLDTVEPHRANFAALALESSTAVRQFLVMVQILRHIDADAPIRMLIAECEDPQTVLSALFFARLFGIADRVDVSPLFETESAMEHGGRFLDALLSEPHYQSYARARGRVAIQTGFSDAGRFVGQIPAALAIERLQGRLADAMRRHGLTDVAALIFNTHGESMGRGAHPGSIRDRLLHPLSLWARRRFASAGVTVEREASFQGGDGYLWFRTPTLALATLVRIVETEADIADRVSADGADPFYDRTDLSLDFYRGIRRVQREHRQSQTYARAITAFGLGLLNETGSRKTRRQTDLSADRSADLRQIRAIPHNAVLQQLGYPVNVLAGFGTAAGDDPEAIATMLAESERGRALLGLLDAANGPASIKTLAAYGELFNSAYWASRPYRGTETALERACLALAERLIHDDRVGVFRRLASRLRTDAVRLHRLLALLPNGARGTQAGDREETRRELGVLHALRIALMQHMFLSVVRVPPFSRANDISRDDVIEMVFSLAIPDALAQLYRAFPVAAPTLADFTLDEPTDYPSGDAQGYAAIRATTIDPIADAFALSLRISVAIANRFGAHG